MSRKQKKYHFIYKTTDTRNGNFYIGMHSTDNLNDGYVGSGDRIKNLKYKHGTEIFNIEILEFLPDRESLKKREQEIVNSDLLKEDKCMNLRTGGEGGFCNDEHKKNFIEGSKKYNFKNRWDDIEFRRKKFFETSNRFKKYWEDGKLKHHPWVKGKKHTDETKRKIGESNSLSQKGEKNSQFGSRWITNGIDNKKIKKTDIIPENWYYGRKK